MAKKKKKSVLTPAIAVLSILIIAVLAVMCVLIVMYMTSEEKPFEQTETTTQRLVTEAPPEETTTEVTTTVTTVSMTKAVTTAPDVEITAETSAMIVDEQTSAEETAPAETELSNPTDYEQSFFENDLFIGDSISTGYSLFGFLPSSNVFAKVGLNPDSALTDKVDDVTAVEKAKAMQPKRIFIMLGTNGLAFMGTTYMKNMMSELVSELKDASPDSAIVIISIPPVTAVHDSSEPEKMTDIIAYNALLEEMCKDLDVNYTDITALLENEDGYLSDVYAEADGLHFLGVTYKTVLSYLQKQYS